MNLIYKKVHEWPLSNIKRTVEVYDDNGEFKVFVDGKDKTYVKEEILCAIRNTTVNFNIFIDKEPGHEDTIRK